MGHDRGVAPDERTEWQKKYDASLDQARADDEPIGEAGVIETSSIAAGSSRPGVCGHRGK
jgi:hypothetical protein